MNALSGFRSSFRAWGILLVVLAATLGTKLAHAGCPTPWPVQEDDYEDDDRPGQARRLDPGEFQSHTIHDGDDLDWTRFVLTARSDITITTSGFYGDTLMTLYGPDSPTQRLARDNNSGQDDFSRIKLQGVAPGRYYVRIEEKGRDDTIEEYLLRLQVTRSGDRYEPDDASNQAKTIQPGETQSRSLDAGEDLDWVRFTLDHDTPATLETNGSQGDTVLALYAAEDTETPLEVDDNGNGLFSRIVAPLLPVGEYLVRVRSAPMTPIPSYTLTLLISDPYEPDDVPAQAHPIQAGEAQERNIHRTGDVDWARFDLAYPADVRVETEGPSGDTALVLYGAGQYDSPLAEDDNGNGTFSRIQVEALPAGSYLVRIRVPGDAATLPHYRLKLATSDQYEPDDTASHVPSIAVGETQVRSLFTGADVDWVSFTLTAPTRVTIETAGPSGNTDLLLYATTPRLRKLASDKDSGAGQFSRIRKKLNAGTYLIQVRAFRQRAEVPRYTLSVTATGS